MTHPTTEQRELLELAAKAAGLPLCDEFDASTAGLLIGRGNGDLQVWNPLTDDGDALRLAVKLGLKVDCMVYAKDPYAATRRAIVSAAAAIAKGEK